MSRVWRCQLSVYPTNGPTTGMTVRTQVDRRTARPEERRVRAFQARSRVRIIAGADRRTAARRVRRVRRPGAVQTSVSHQTKSVVELARVVCR